MVWYLIQTWAGREEDMAEEIRRTIPDSMYEECFVIGQERIWRRQQQSVVHVESMFPGCVFLVCKKTMPLLCHRKTALAMAPAAPAFGRGAVWGDFTFLPLMREDVDFLLKISGRDHVARLSYVGKNNQGQICQMAGPLVSCREQVERYQFKKRYALVRRRFLGEERGIVFGIMLKEDLEQKLLYDNREKEDLILGKGQII